MFRIIQVNLSARTTSNELSINFPLITSDKFIGLSTIHGHVSLYPPPPVFLSLTEKENMVFHSNVLHSN